MGLAFCFTGLSPSWRLPVHKRIDLGFSSPSPQLPDPDLAQADVNRISGASGILADAKGTIYAADIPRGDRGTGILWVTRRSLRPIYERRCWRNPSVGIYPSLPAVLPIQSQGVLGHYSDEVRFPSSCPITPKPESLPALPFGVLALICLPSGLRRSSQRIG